DNLIPRDTFDVGAVAKNVGPDPDKLRQWVRTQTRLVPYKGLLRGARGVLMDRVGNSLDRSLLLASLLEVQGFSVRLARAQLEGQAAEALQQTAKPVTVPESAAVSETFAATLDAYAGESGSDPSAMRRQLQRLRDKGRTTVDQLRRRVAAQ